MSKVVDKRVDFSFFFDVRNGNPNGDPDAGNIARHDVDTGLGIVTDGCVKRKVRDYVCEVHGDRVLSAPDGGDDLLYKLYIARGAVLNEVNADMYDQCGVKLDKKGKPASSLDSVKRDELVDVLCRTYFDVRAFGAVSSTGNTPIRQTRGPVQLCFGESIDPIFPTDMGITRVARAERNESGMQQGQGRKAYVPYGLYRVNGFVTPAFARRTLFTWDDLSVFFEALWGGIELDRSASRGLQTPRHLYVFEHASAIGNARAADLFDLVKVRKVCDGAPTRFSDYEFDFDEASVPDNVECKIDPVL